MSLNPQEAATSFVTREPMHPTNGKQSFGERLADRMAAFGGSWTFILLFLGFLAAWAFLNTEVLGPRRAAFDPYPYIFLNLFLSMLAALQAPVIMMSQNRQAARDRVEAQNDYNVNLNAEMQIRDIHEKLDQLREERWEELLQLQREQLRILGLLSAARGARADIRNDDGPA